jgi:hypothetical protein
MKNSPVKFMGAGLNIPTPQAKQLGAPQQNPFSPTEQGAMGGVFNPTGNDINQFQSNQGFNKNQYNIGYGQPEGALNPNTLNEPPIPTEGSLTTTDLASGNVPMGDDFSGLDLATAAPEQGMGSTQTGGVTANLTRKEQRQLRRKERRGRRWGAMLSRKGNNASDRQYRRTGQRSGAMGAGTIFDPSNPLGS